MIDDDRLGELFRSAASDAAAPPAFDHSDVVTASRRSTARRRGAVTGALGVLAFVGIGAAVVLPGSGGVASTASTPFVASDVAARREAAPALPAPAPMQAAEGAPAAAADAGVLPLGPGTGPCADRQDPALRALVEQVMPEVVGASAAVTTDECRPGGERGVSVEVGDGAAAGLLTVIYRPPGASVSLAPGAVSAPTVSGGTVIAGLRSAAPGGAVPFEGRLAAVAAFLAHRL